MIVVVFIIWCVGVCVTVRDLVFFLVCVCAFVYKDIRTYTGSCVYMHTSSLGITTNVNVSL